jgi:hypothetical protein
MVLLTEACQALTARMMVPLFWPSYTHFSSHPMLHQPVHRQVMSEITDSVPYIVDIGKEPQCGVGAAVRACDMKMFLVAYVSGFIAKCLIININCDTCKKCLIHEVPSPLDIYTGFKEHSSTFQSLTYPTEKLVIDCWYYCDCFGECDVNDGSVRFS